MGFVWKLVVVVTATFFWIDFLLNSFAPQDCGLGFVTVGQPKSFYCVSGHKYKLPEGVR